MNNDDLLDNDDGTLFGKQLDSTVHVKDTFNSSLGSLNNIDSEPPKGSSFLLNRDKCCISGKESQDSGVSSEEQSLELINQMNSPTDIENGTFEPIVDILQCKFNTMVCLDKRESVASHSSAIDNTSTTASIPGYDDSKIAADCVNSPVTPNVVNDVQDNSLSPKKLILDNDCDESNKHTETNQNSHEATGITKESDAVHENDLNEISSSHTVGEYQMSEDDFFNDLGIPSQRETSVSKERKKIVKETLKHKKKIEDELQDIHSESQRLTRESDIRLPYHKPRVSSLSEFLNRKSLGKENHKILPLTPKFSTEVLKTSDYETPPLQMKSVNFKTPRLSDFKRKLLKEAQVSSLTPSLSAKSDFVELDISEKQIGLNNFMSRFVKQNQKRIDIPQSQEIKLNLVCKEVDKNGKEDLKPKEITVKINHTVGPTPVNTAKFNIFKEHLLSEITKKKKEKQETRHVAYELDNEDGFDEEEEMSEDQSDDNEKSDADESDLEDFLGLDKCKSNNEDLPPSQQPDDSLKLVLEDSEIQDSQNTCSTPKTIKMIRMNSGTLFLDDSVGENSQPTDHSQQMPAASQRDLQKLFLEDSQVKREQNKSHDELDSSFEFMGSLIPAHQPGGGLKYGGCSVSEDEAGSFTETPGRLVSGKDSFDDDLDLNSTCNSPIFTKLIRKDDIGDTQNVNELLELCSGKFTSFTQEPSQEFSKRSDIDNSNPSANKLAGICKNYIGHTQNLNELLEICSGKFPSSNQISSQNFPNTFDSSENSFPSINKTSENTELLNELITPCCKSEGTENFHCKINEVSDEDDDIIFTSRKKIASKKFTKLTFDSDGESDLENNEQTEISTSKSVISNENIHDIDFQSENYEEEEDENKDENDEAEDGSEIDTAKHQLMKVADFFEEEAELSGSDVGSEDEYEGDDDEENIFDDAVPSDEEMSEEQLRNQIGKAHLKILQDDDKKELRFFQEMYLEDGDLHTDGNGRERKFRWRNTDNNADDTEDQNDKEAGSGDENEQSFAENEKWRIQRFEREKWLQEQEALHINEQWTGFKLNKRNKSTPTTPMIIQYSGAENSSPFLLDQPKSFLSRNKDFCNELAEKFQKQESNNNVGRRSTKNFLFVSKSPGKQNKRSAETVVIKEAKIRKLNVSRPAIISKKSVFNFID